MQFCMTRGNLKREKFKNVLMKIKQKKQNTVELSIVYYIMKSSGN